MKKTKIRETLEEKFLKDNGRPWSGGGVEWYQRDGTPYGLGKAKTLDEWVKIMKKVEKDLTNWEKKNVQQTKLWWGGRVSTVWLGLDQSMGFIPSKTGKPVIFETMVFPGHSMMRYETEEEAKEGHEIMVKTWSQPAVVVKYLLTTERMKKVYAFILIMIIAFIINYAFKHLPSEESKDFIFTVLVGGIAGWNFPRFYNFLRRKGIL